MMVALAARDGQFRMRCWPDATRGTAPYEVSSEALPDLRAKAVSLLGEGAYRYIELSVWNIELSDWVRMEKLEAAAGENTKA